MAKQVINTGATPNDTTGDTLYSGAVKVNENFTEVYNALGMGSGNIPVTSITSGSGIHVDTTGSAVTLTNTTNIFATVAVTSVGTITASGLTDTLTFTPGNNVTLGVQGHAITISSASQVQSDWNQLDELAVSFIKNKPGLATVATSGYYSDLINPPNLALVATSNDYRDLSHLPVFAEVAFTGDYANLLNPPFIPTDISELTDNTNLIVPAGVDIITFTGNTVSATTNDRIVLQPSNFTGPSWQFNGSGVLDFPDSTHQSTAWAGGKIVSAPTSSIGAVGDVAGSMAFSSEAIFYCIADYDGLSNIWVTTPWIITGAW